MFFFLIHEFKNNDERYEWLMAHLSQKNLSALLREALYITRNREDAKDLMMEMMMIGIDKCHQVNDENRVFSWLFTILHREAVRKVKRDKLSFREQGEIDKRINQTDFVESVESRLEKESEKQAVRALVSRLKFPAREIVLMRTRDDMDFHQIAEELHMNYHTVRSRFNRTMRDMRREMEKWHHE